MTDHIPENKHHAKFLQLSIIKHPQEDSHPIHDLQGDQILGQNKDDMENPATSMSAKHSRALILKLPNTC